MSLNDPTYLKHRHWMKHALELARHSGEADEVPVGCVIVDRLGNILAQAQNRRERDKDPTAHAEILALRAAGQTLNTWHLNDCTLYVTLEPCPMCAGAIIAARLGLLVYALDDLKTGSIRSVANLPDSKASNHRVPVIAGILESQSRHLLQTWFTNRRHKNKPQD